MTFDISPISANSLTFSVLGVAMILVAWYGNQEKFMGALALASVTVIASWLSLLDLAALLLFVVPPYFLIRRIWGHKETVASRSAALIIAWEVVLFVYLRKYEWTGDQSWLDHPIAIIGISYMLFRIIHLVVEAPYMGHLQITPIRYAAYILAFWTLLSGPIQRYDDFIDGLKAVGRPGDRDAVAAAHRMINGLIKAFIVAPVFLEASDIKSLSATNANWLDFLIVLYAYPAYLYLNFSGYTDFVIGIARMCGFNTLPENFNRPYLARNLLDFWTRWHISFGTWIRHYVFTPMSKNLLGATPPALHNLMLAFCVLVTFQIVGAWHGTTLNFLIFGLMHGVGIIIVALYGRILKTLLDRKQRKAFENNVIVRVVSTILCFHFVAATVLLFPNSAGELRDILSAYVGI